MMPRKTDGNRTSERISRSLEAAIDEAERIGYISAHENRQHLRELMDRVDRPAATGKVKP